MECIKQLIKKKIKLCLSGITDTSNNASDVNEAKAVKYLALALTYVDCIKESEGNKNE